jgi:hypothetical protein
MFTQDCVLGYFQTSLSGLDDLIRTYFVCHFSKGNTLL